MRISWMIQESKAKIAVFLAKVALSLFFLAIMVFPSKRERR